MNSQQRHEVRPSPAWMRRFPALTAAWERSESTLAQLRERLGALQGDDRIATIAVSGSLGRNEQTRQSDVDLIVISREPLPPIAATQLVDKIRNTLKPLSLPLPKPDGIFGRPTNRQELLTRETLGVIDEDLATYGHRMQLLLDSRPVFGFKMFEELQHGILDRFWNKETQNPDRSRIDRRLSLRESTPFCGAKGDEQRPLFLERSPWRTLIDELLRYHRTLCLRYDHFSREPSGEWRERFLKAGHSRLVNIAGLLFLLGESMTRNSNRLTWVAERLSLTPWERIEQTFRRYNDNGWDSAAARYDRFLVAWNDDSVRQSILRHSGKEFTELANNATLLRQELLRFLLERVRRRDWPEVFIQDLLL